MKIKISIDNGDEYGMYGSYELKSPSNKLSFADGEPEDNSMNRNFNDVYNITALVEEAYEAGKSGESLEFEFETIEEQ